MPSALTLALYIAAMIDVRVVLASATTCIVLAGCGPSAAPGAAKPDVIVTFDMNRHGCVVALYTEPHGSGVACDEVVPFVRDELRLPGGSIYELRTGPGADEAQMARVGAGLNGAGYRLLGAPPK